MTEILYKTGDATTPNLRTPHICNDIGRRGEGFVLAVSARWPQPERAYGDWYQHRAGTTSASARSNSCASGRAWT
ncbi:MULTISPECIES: hypothetical protein [Nocardia]|uniref:hypothetical protein n=1 Tax=Nocardia TaxID=1817 RepID=UPI0024550251|nr:MULTISPECIES: hypothetical protein [Nocardia]